VFLMVLTFTQEFAAQGSKCQNRNTSVAHLTFGARLRILPKPNVGCKSYTRTMDLLVFLMVLTFAQEFVAQGSKCQNRNTGQLSLIEPKTLRFAPGSSTSSRRLKDAWFKTSSLARFSPFIPMVMDGPRPVSASSATL